MVNQGQAVTGSAYDIRALCRDLFEEAKGWQTAALVLRLGVFALGALVILLSLLPKLAPFLIAFFSIIAELCLLRSDEIKRIAEAMLRKLDYHDSLGWSLTGVELSDILVAAPARLRKRFHGVGQVEEYFISEQDPGALRALENMQESAWWSKHLAREAGNYYFAATGLLVLISVVALLVSIETIRNFDILSNIGRVVTSTFMLTFSLGLIRLALGYSRFSRQADHLQQQAEDLSGKGNLETVQVIKIMADYHLARASAPVIPTWLWKLRRKDLNELWIEYHRRGK